MEELEKYCHTCECIIEESYHEFEDKRFNDIYYFCSECFESHESKINEVEWHVPIFLIDYFLRPERLNGKTSENEDAKV